MSIIDLALRLKDLKINLDKGWLVESFDDVTKSEIILLSRWNEQVVIYKENGTKGFD